MKNSVYAIRWYVILVCTCLNAVGGAVHAQQFVKYKCAAKGESGEVIIATRETINTKILRESDFALLIDFERDVITFSETTAYPFRLVSNRIMEKTTSDYFDFKSYETDTRTSQDLKINRRNGNLYFLRTWDLDFKSYKFTELRGVCKKEAENLQFKVTPRVTNKSLKFGDVVIPPQFSIAWDFNDGLASVWARDEGVKKSGAIDANGNVKIPLTFSLVRSFIEGRAGACSHGTQRKCGYINKEGRWVVEPVYDEVWDFNDGVASVTLGEDKDVLNATTGKWTNLGGQKSAYINTKGEILGNKFYDAAYSFKNGLGQVGNGISREQRFWGFVDRSGNEVIPLKFGPGELSAIGEFSDGLAPARLGTFLDGTYGFIDRAGKFVVPPIYSGAHPFSEGKAAVCRMVRTKGRIDEREKSSFSTPNDDKWECSFIDRSGRILFPFKEYSYGKFSDGLATACRRDTYWDGSTPSCGYIDASGKLVIGEKFLRAEDFKNGYAKVSVSSRPRLWGLINRKGEFVVKPIYSELGNVSEGLLAFKVSNDEYGKWGYLWAR